jgi:hypothetical protein
MSERPGIEIDFLPNQVFDDIPESHKEELIQNLVGLNNPEYQAEIYTNVRTLCEYLHQNSGIKHVVAVDKAMRPGLIGVQAYWRRKFPSVKMPQVHIINPAGFATKESTHPGVLSQFAVKERDAFDLKDVRLEDSEVIKDLEESYPALCNDKDSSILIVDNCAHSGETFSAVRRIFQKAGFSDFKIITFNEPDQTARQVVDGYFIPTTFRPSPGCRPFGPDQTVQKVANSVTSIKNPDIFKREEGKLYRVAVKTIVETYLDAEESGELDIDQALA